MVGVEPIGIDPAVLEEPPGLHVEGHDPLGPVALARVDAARQDDLLGTYSSGMRQRVKLVLATLFSPPLLLLDEASLALDEAGTVLVAERIGWLLDGAYGFGAMSAAKRVLGSRRANRVAWLVQTIGAVEWRCRPASVIAAWKKLSPAEKRALDAAVKRAIKEHEKTTE